MSGRAPLKISEKEPKRSGYSAVDLARALALCLTSAAFVELGSTRLRRVEESDLPVWKTHSPPALLSLAPKPTPSKPVPSASSRTMSASPSSHFCSLLGSPSSFGVMPRPVAGG